MKRWLALVLASVGSIIALLGCGGEEQTAVSSTAPVAQAAENPHGSILNECLHYTNISRQNFGLVGLEPAYGLHGTPYGGAWEPLQQAAFNQARDMAVRDYFSHDTPEGWSPGTRLEGLGYYGPWAENIYCGSSDPGDAVRAWMESYGHRANILDATFTKVGIAHYYDAGSSCQHYWVMVLGR